MGSMCFSLFCNLLMVHLVGDFYLQSDKTCAEKINLGFRSKYLYVHGLLIFILSWVALWSWEFWWLALIVSLTHILIDGIKSKCGNNLKNFIIDQLAHMSVLAAVTWVLIRYFGWEQLDLIPVNRMFVLVVLAFIICAKPANIFIKTVLQTYRIDNQSKEENSQFKAGSLIGTIERWLILVFVILEQYEAVGFLLAAKSIIRFKDTETSKTEYVLAGTLISVAVAVACGLVISYSI